MASGDLRAMRSEREQEASEKDAIEHVRKRAREARHELMRECPVGYALDQVHAMALLADQGGGARSRLLQRAFLVRAMLAQGWSPAGIGAAFNLDAEQVAHERAREIWWRPTRERLENYPDEVRFALAELGVQPES